MSVTTLPNFFTVPESARHARVSAWTIRREIDAGRLRARRIGRCVRILDEELARWMREGDEGRDVTARRDNGASP